MKKNICTYICSVCVCMCVCMCVLKRDHHKGKRYCDMGEESHTVHGDRRACSELGRVKGGQGMMKKDDGG